MTEHVDWRLTARDLEAEVTRLREYERRWGNLERLAHHWGQWPYPTCDEAASQLWDALLVAAGDGLYCREPGHDCATWQPPVETQRESTP